MARGTRQEWAERVRRWRTRGETASEFARREGLNANTLRWWASRLKAEPTVPVAFVEVVPPEAARGGTNGALELVVGKIRIEVRPNFDEALLRRVLAILETR